MPKFAEAISNVTVSIGRDALLACVVDNLKQYKVIRFFQQMLIRKLKHLGGADLWSRLNIARYMYGVEHIEFQ